MARKYGWIPDVPDQRDMLFRKKRTVKILDKVDLRPQCSPVQNQGDIGSCTGNAIASAMEFDYIKQGMPHQDISRLFIYYNEREMEGTVNEDAGAMIRDGIKVCAKYGACLESVWEYDTSKFKKKPPRAAYKDAENRQALEYRRIATFNDFLSALSEGFPVVFGFGIYESFESPEVARTGVMPMPLPTERCIGGHAVLAVGYDKEKDIAIVKNSWGTEWGDKGFFYMPLDVIRNKNLSDDFWCITKTEMAT